MMVSNKNRSQVFPEIVQPLSAILKNRHLSKSITNKSIFEHKVQHKSLDQIKKDIFLLENIRLLRNYTNNKCNYFSQLILIIRFCCLQKYYLQYICRLNTSILTNIDFCQKYFISIKLINDFIYITVHCI